MNSLLVLFLTSLLYVVGNSDCNYGFWSYFIPLVDGECGTCSTGTCGNIFGGLKSIQVNCIDSSNANLTYYSDNSCGTVASTTALSSGSFSCGNSGSCSSMVVDSTTYDSKDCSGNTDYETSITLAEGDYCYSTTITGLGTLYVGVEVTSSLLKYEFYSDSSCTTSAGISSGNGTAGCENDGDGNSTKTTISNAPIEKTTKITFITAITFGIFSLFY